MTISASFRATALLCLAIGGLQATIVGARAEDSDDRQARLARAKQQLTSSRSIHSFRSGCMHYIYGCGYGTAPGYGYAPSYGEGTNRAK